MSIDDDYSIFGGEDLNYDGIVDIVEQDSADDDIKYLNEEAIKDNIDDDDYDNIETEDDDIETDNDNYDADYDMGNT